jgi:hypothetical protein
MRILIGSCDIASDLSRSMPKENSGNQAAENEIL